MAVATICRVACNAGGRSFWFDRRTYASIQGTLHGWLEVLAELIDDKGVTHIVLFGDTRPIQARAVEVARSRGLCVRVCQYGYLRPCWTAYEGGGSNGHSRLMDI